MNNFTLKTNIFKFFKNYKFELFSAIIFILFSLIHYWNLGYDHYKDNWGVDQFDIENISRRIINGESLVGHLTHGIGYPIVIAPFINIAANPFNITNFFIFTFFASNIFKNVELAVKDKINKITLISFILIALIFSSDMKFWIIGASNSLTAVLIILSILWSISPVVPKNLPYILGLFSGLVFSSRYVDFFLLIPLYFSAIFNYAKINKKSLLKNLLISFSISFIFIILSLTIHQLILGNFFATPYDNRIPDPSRLINASFGENIIDQFQNRYFSWIIPNLYSIFIDYSSFASKLSAKSINTVLVNFPILIFAPFSIINSLLFYFRLPKTILKKRLNITLICLVTSLLTWTIFYSSGWAFTVHDLYWHCLRYFMGWNTLLVFLTFYGLTLKPCFKTILISTIVYLLLLGYPSHFVKNEFKNNEIVKYINVSEGKSSNINKRLNLPIPFNEGRKSLLFMKDNGQIIAVDNFTNNLILGECSYEKFDIDLPENNIKNCSFVNSNSRYYPEDGMEFLNIRKFNNYYEVVYKIFENGKPLLKNLIFNYSETEIENNGFVKLFLDTKDRYRILDKGRTFYVKRNNNFYLNNLNNIYWPNWPLIGAEKINSKNQIITSNKKDKIFCIWEVDRNWNFKKDRLCGSYGDFDIGKYEKEFGVDINNDQFINKTYINRNLENIKKTINDSSKIIFKVDPIKFEKNQLKITTKEKYKNKIKLNIKLNKTGNGSYKNFPNIVSINCNEEDFNCSAYKIGRFNNLWRIWIKTQKKINTINLNIEEISNDKPLFWPIQYVSIKS